MNILEKAKLILTLPIQRIFDRALQDLSVEFVDKNINDIQASIHELVKSIGVMQGDLEFNIKTRDHKHAQRNTTSRALDSKLIEQSRLMTLVNADGIVTPEEQEQVNRLNREIHALEAQDMALEAELHQLDGMISSTRVSLDEHRTLRDQLELKVTELQSQRAQLEVLINQRKTEQITDATITKVRDALGQGDWDVKKILEREERKTLQATAIRRERQNAPAVNAGEIVKNSEIEDRLTERRRRLGLLVDVPPQPALPDTASPDQKTGA